MNRFWNRIKTMLTRYTGYLLFFVVGLAVLIGAEAGVLYYLDHVYLHESDHYQVTRLASSSSAAQKHHSLTLSGSAQNVVVSHDGGYLAYLENGTIQIVNMTTGETSTVPAVANRTVAYFEWVYDRNRLTIVEKSTGANDSSTSSSSSRKSSSSSRSSSSGDSFAELYSYDLSDKTIQLVRDYMNDKDVKISLNSANDVITDMDMSTETVVTYLKITSTTGRSRLWEANITVKNAALSDLPTHNIGKIQSLKSSDDLLYEDQDTGHVYLYNAKTQNSTLYSINDQNNLKLLGFDQNDNQYVGIVQNNLVTSIAYGNPISKTWQALSLPSPVDPTAISVAYSGSVFVNDKNTTTVKELVSGKSETYTGSLLGIYGSGFYSLSNGTVEDHPMAATSSKTSSTSSGSSSTSSSSGSSTLTASAAPNTSARYKSSASGSSSQ